MSGLFASLTMAARSVAAQEYGLNVTGQNIANLNTEGYVRRTVNFAEVAPGAGGGVRAVGAQAQRDALLDARVRQEFPAEQRYGAVADSLAVVETSLGTVGQSIDGALTSFFDGFSSLALDPTSSVVRDGVVLTGQQLATAFNNMAARLTDARSAADSQVRGGIDQINTLAAQIAQLNTAIGSANGADAEALKDQQGVALQTLAGLADVTALQRPEGGYDVSIGTGRALVVGSNAYTLSAVPTGVAGLAAVSLGGVDISSEVRRGELGGLLQVRDTIVPGYQQRLDQLAFDVAGQVNTLHQAGTGLTGATGQAFFTPIAAAAGAASAIKVAPALAGNSSLVAASLTGTAGDNQTATAISNLRDARVLSGGTTTLNDSWSQLVYRVGSDAGTAQAQRESAHQVVDQLTQLRDQVSGVSLDEEAAAMLKFQRAYEANARLFMSVNTTLSTLMAMVGVV
jgi:flagellar hook-associated protein 1 FlgK